MSIKITTREKWVDIVKGIGIFLVVLGHITKNQEMVTGIYAFHMPLFFFVSGWLISSKVGECVLDKKFVKKKFMQLVVPFIEYRAILVVYWFLIERRFRELDLGPIWFLPTMFISYLMIASILRYISNRVNQIIAFLLLWFVMVTVISIHSIPSQTPEVLNIIYIYFIRSVCGCSWMVLGIIGKELKENITKIHKSYLSIFIILLIIQFGMAFFNGEVSLFNLQFGNSYSVYYMTALSGCILLMLLSKIIKYNCCLEYMGRTSMIIMAFHEPIKRVIFKIYDTLSGKLNGGLASYEILRESVGWSLLFTLLVVVVCTVLIVISRKAIKKIPNVGWKNIIFAFLK